MPPLSPEQQVCGTIGHVHSTAGGAVRDRCGLGWSVALRVCEYDTHMLLSNFRDGYNPRITVADEKPLERCSMCDVKSRNYFEQVKGYGTRAFDQDRLQKVSRRATTSRTHFVLMDAGGVSDSHKTDSRPLEHKKRA